MSANADKIPAGKSEAVAGNVSEQQGAGKSGINLQDNRPGSVAQQKTKKTGSQESPVVQRMFGIGHLGGADSGADNEGEFYLETQRREARARREAERQRQQQVAAARRLITGNMQLSANRPAVLREFHRLLQAGAQGTPEELAYRAMNNVMNSISGSDNADREQHGGERGFSRR